MARWPKPPEGSWTEHYPELGTGLVTYEDSISPEFYELEREAIFKRAWLNVARVEQLRRNGSYFTKEIEVANTSIVVLRDNDGQVRAFHNICRHRGNKLVWNDFPRYWPITYNTMVYEGDLLFIPARTARERLAHEMAAVTYKEFALQDANTLEATQSMLESRVVDWYPLSDQEITCRHFHKTAGEWVEEYRRERLRV